MANVAQIVTKLTLDGSQFKGNVQNISKSVLKLSAAGAAVTAALGAAAISTAKFQDDTIKAARTIGTTAKEFSALRFAADLAGVGQNNLIKSLAKLNAPTAMMREELKKLGVEYANSAGKARDSADIIGDLSDAFKNMDRPVERSASAFKLFGARGVELVNFLKDGSGAINKLKDDAEKLGLTFSQEVGKRAEKFNDDIVRLKSSIKGLSDGLGTAVIEMVETSGVIDDITDAVINVREWFEGLDDHLKTSILTIASLAAGITTLLGVLAGITVIAPAIGAAFKMMMGPVGLAIAGFAALATGTVLLINYFNKAEREAAKLRKEIAKNEEINKRAAAINNLVKTQKGLKKGDRKSTRLNSSHIPLSRMPSSA